MLSASKRPARVPWFLRMVTPCGLRGAGAPRHRPGHPAKAEPFKSPVPLWRFRYDAKHDMARCPRGRVLRPAKAFQHGRFFYADAKDCSAWPLFRRCVSPSRTWRTIVISDDHPVLLYARRRRER